jgi:hypothetical protein
VIDREADALNGSKLSEAFGDLLELDFRHGASPENG